MKKFIVLTAVLVLMSTSAFATIISSAHDFSATAWSNNSTEICQPCHTPHNALQNNALLWNHAPTTSTFVPYTGNGTMDATPTDLAATNPSRLCLSCHDGTVTLDNWGGTAGTTTIAASANFGSDLSNDHPIGFAYDVAMSGSDGELAVPVPAVGGGTVGNTTALPLFGALGDEMECGTCHDVHNGTVAAAAAQQLLYVNNAASALCLNCHNK